MANDMKIVSFNPPEDVLFHILLRVPVKTLIRLKRVCKACHAVIENPNFVGAKNRMQSSLELNPTYSNVLVKAKGPGNTKNCRLLHFDDKPFDFELPYLSNMEYFEVVGICNGLVCLSLCPDDHELMICNPTNGHSRRISPFKFLEGESDVIFLGFGFDENGYYVIRIVYSGRDYDTNNPVIRGELYTMCTNTCRVVEVKEGKRTNCYWNLASKEQQEAVVIDGIFYWTARFFCGDPYVVSFDICKEEFFVIDAWNQAYEYQDYWQILVFKDELAMALTVWEVSFKMYVLNNEGMRWTMIYNNDFTVIPIYPAGWIGRIRLLGSTINGELILAFHGENNLKLLMYDPNSQEIVKCVGNVDVQGDVDKIYLYTESLTPIN